MATWLPLKNAVGANVAWAPVPVPRDRDPRELSFSSTVVRDLCSPLSKSSSSGIIRHLVLLAASTSLMCLENKGCPTRVRERFFLQGGQQR